MRARARVCMRVCVCCTFLSLVRGIPPIAHIRINYKLASVLNQGGVVCIATEVYTSTESRKNVVCIQLTVSLDGMQFVPLITYQHTD